VRSTERAVAPEAGRVTESGERGRRVAEAAALLRRVEEAVAHALVGQRALVERMLIALLADGHVLVEGVPGIGKTLAVASLARALGLEFRRIQFTPDLLPADVIGTEIFRQGQGDFTVKKGPVFAELVLADEINRAPPKVQSALLEAMQERQVTIGERTLPLPRPFLVFATQNPIEHEGTYPLPEAELDRFLFKVTLSYPARAEEEEMLRLHGRSARTSAVEPVATREAIAALPALLDDVHVDAKITDYLLRIIAATRDPKTAGAPELAGAIRLGGSPRASLTLLQTAKARALLRGRDHVEPSDVKELAPDVLRHRLVLGFEAEARGLTADSVVAELLRHLPVP
jgi:MoxR-like ATPase